MKKKLKKLKRIEKNNHISRFLQHLAVNIDIPMIYSTSMLMMVCLVSVAGDDIAIGLTIRDNSSMASGATSVIPDDATSVGSAPPLPNTLPPPMPTKNDDSLLDDSSFYLPSVAGDDNHADDGTDIEDEILDNDEFGAIPTNRAPRKKMIPISPRAIFRYSVLTSNRVASTDLMIGSRIAARRPCFTIPTTMALGLRR